MTTALPSLPWEPLQRAVLSGRPFCTGDASCPACHGDGNLSGVLCGTCKSIAEQLGISDRSVVRYRSLGRVPARSGDTFAVRAGCHPIEVWGEEWERLADGKAA